MYDHLQTTLCLMRVNMMLRNVLGSILIFVLNLLNWPKEPITNPEKDCF